MAKPKDERPPVADDPAVTEVFVDDLVGVQGDGNAVLLTFAVNRMTTDRPTPKIKRVIRARLVMPNQTAVMVLNNIRTVLEQHGLLGFDPGTKPN